MAPIGATLAGKLGFRPDAYLLASAVGAACDCRTPVGQQCNTMVMAPGGCRFVTMRGRARRRACWCWP